MAKKKNFIVRYFSNFGLKQISELLLFAGLIALIVSLFFTEQVEFARVFMSVTLAVVAFAFALCLVRHLRVVFNKKINHRSPEWKSAVVNTVVAGLFFAVALFGCIFGFCS
ncbi:MAG: hypothetical protein E7353_07760 [Clostridiales bacterium]|nr:hypothetical protein [Clostridiales bacterium]